MVSLVDIVPQKRTVNTAGGDLELRGLGLRQIADLFLQFPSLRNLFVEGAPDVSAAEFIIQLPDAVNVVIAEAAGLPTETEMFDGLSPDDALDCLMTIRDLTFPRGLTPFLEKLGNLLGTGQSAAVQPMKVPDTTALLAPNGLSPQDIPAAK